MNDSELVSSLKPFCEPLGLHPYSISLRPRSRGLVGLAVEAPRGSSLDSYSPEVLNSIISFIESSEPSRIPITSSKVSLMYGLDPRRVMVWERVGKGTN